MIIVVCRGPAQCECVLLGQTPRHKGGQDGDSLGGGRTGPVKKLSYLEVFHGTCRVANALKLHGCRRATS